MKTPKTPLIIFFLASAIGAHATAITLTGNLSNFQAQSSNPADFAGLSTIAIGDPYSLKLVFDDSLFSIPAPGSGSLMANGLQSFELSVNGVLRVTMANLDLQFFNNVGGRDSIWIQDVAPMTVHGMSPSVSAGTISLQIHDSSQTALQVGQPPDFGLFFDNVADGFSMGVGHYVFNPYSDFFSDLHFGITGDPALALPPPASVPDSGPSLALLISGLAALGVVRRTSRV